MRVCVFLCKVGVWLEEDISIHLFAFFSFHQRSLSFYLSFLLSFFPSFLLSFLFVFLLLSINFGPPGSLKGIKIERIGW